MHLIRPSVEGQSTQSNSDPARWLSARGIHAAGEAAIREGTYPAARSLYLHVPFCFHKCHYCDFYSIVDTQDRQEPFTERLIREIAAIAPCAGGLPLRTIFVGGGTPSLLRPALWSRLLGALRDHLDFSMILAGEGEFTVECNPETVTAELMGLLRAGGVNRVSMGAQSFNDAHLKTLERHHRPQRVGEALALAEAAGIARRSVDLIFAIPGQSLEAWREDLETALALRIEHVSAYNLTYEPKTAMTARMERGEFTPTDEDTEADMFDLAGALTRTAGFARYEVSNYARPGRACRHNLAYWRQEPWLAAGPSASGHLAGHRWKNTPRLDTYLSCDDDGFAAIVDAEGPDPRRALAERLMTGLRLAEGVSASDALRAASALGSREAERLAGVMERYRASGHMGTWNDAGEESGERWVVTDRGVLIADRIAAEAMAAVS